MDTNSKLEGVAKTVGKPKYFDSKKNNNVKTGDNNVKGGIARPAEMSIVKKRLYAVLNFKTSALGNICIGTNVKADMLKLSTEASIKKIQEIEALKAENKEGLMDNDYLDKLINENKNCGLYEIETTGKNIRFIYVGEIKC